MATQQLTKDYFVDFDYIAKDYSTDGFQATATISATLQRLQQIQSTVRTHRIQKETRQYAVPQESRSHVIQKETRSYRIQEGE